MRYRLIRTSIATSGQPAGRIVEVPEAVAERLVRSGAATYVEKLSERLRHRPEGV